MRYLDSYKAFESYSDDVFPEGHTLAGMNIIKVLEEIYVAIPQEEIRYSKVVSLPTREDCYTTMVDVGDKKVNVTVSKAPLSPFATIVIDRYAVGMKKINWALFRRMKKLYNDLFK